MYGKQGENQRHTEGRNELEEILYLEDLAEKKARIYSKLLTEQSLAEDMETIAERHQACKAELGKFLTGKVEESDKEGKDEEQ